MVDAWLRYLLLPFFLFACLHCTPAAAWGYEYEYGDADNITNLLNEYHSGYLSPAEFGEEYDHLIAGKQLRHGLSDYPEDATWSAPLEGIGNYDGQGDSNCSGGQCFNPDLQPEQAPPDNSVYWDNCVLDEMDKPVLNGVDRHADLLPGGLDGIYNLEGCFDGKPMYRRVNSPAAEDRTLFWSEIYYDWEFAAGDEPTEDQMLMYGDSGYLEPGSIPNWHLAASLNTPQLRLMESEDEDVYFVVPDAVVSCADSN